MVSDVNLQPYSVGGGDSTRACPETFRLETKDAASGLSFHWQVVNPGTEESQQEAVGREGVALVAHRGASGDFLVAFGGSNGKCSNEVYAMRVANKDEEAL